ncbi:hypothetical protein, partial [Klebsiella pneumoniae]|uniref:hypothetical protein n=1 Tax=Klebsiella pneumoniae TaxID=573 RepID=UPI001E5B095C
SYPLNVNDRRKESRTARSSSTTRMFTATRKAYEVGPHAAARIAAPRRRRTAGRWTAAGAIA